jgi:hypothetical protein
VAEGTIELTDELLVAYVDDELNVDQRAMVSGVLDRNPALCRRADEMRLARDLLREAFPLQQGAILPARIETAVKHLAAATKRYSSQTRATSGFRLQWPHAMAAGLLLCIAAGASYFFLRGMSESTDDEATALTQIDLKNPLHGVLESSASAELIEVPEENAAMRAVLTFRAKDGRFCREFEILADAGGSTGIACRENGRWRAEVLVKAAAILPNDTHYVPAAGSDDPAVAEVFERLVQGEPLGAVQEAHLLAGGWTTVAQDP